MQDERKRQSEVVMRFNSLAKVPLLVVFWALYPILDIETPKGNELLKREAQGLEVNVFLKLPFDFKKCL